MANDGLPPAGRQVFLKNEGSGFFCGTLLGEGNPWGPRMVGKIYPGGHDPKSFTHWAEPIEP